MTHFLSVSDDRRFNSILAYCEEQCTVDGVLQGLVLVISYSRLVNRVKKVV